MDVPQVSPAELIRLKRTALGMSARALSIAAGLSPSYVSKLEAGLIEASLRSLSSITKVLHFSKAEVYSIVMCAS